MNTEELRSHFLVQGLMQPGELKLTYSHYDRMIIGGAVPSGKGITLSSYPSLRSDYFLERREMGIINIGGAAEISVEGKTYDLQQFDCLYIGMGNKKVVFKSVKKNHPAKLYILSAPAHHHYPVQLLRKDKASPVQMGAQATANIRTIYKYIHAAGIKSCQLVMGLTLLDEGSVWNTMPTHVHDRRMEAYFYFNLPVSQRVIHLMGEPAQTRHLVVANEEAIISPPWSIHSGCGTSSYGFIWGMAGENYDYTDMDPVDLNNLK